MVPQVIVKDLFNFPMGTWKTPVAPFTNMDLL